VDDEEGEEVWGYLVPMDARGGDVLVLRRRQACPVPTTLVGKTNGKDSVPKTEFKEQEENYENEKQEHGVPAGGYLIGRHRECGKLLSCTRCKP
jgi:serine/threonine-protein kinase Chk2